MTAVTPNTTENSQYSVVDKSLPLLFLRVEGLFVLVAAISLYAIQGYKGWVFVALLLAPDIPAFLWYALDKRSSSIGYNIIHHYGIPVVLAILGLLMGQAMMLQIALIWCAHIGMDRFFGYGFKYVGEFKKTHFSNI